MRTHDKLTTMRNRLERTQIETIARLEHGVTPFPGEALQQAQDRLDLALLLLDDACAIRGISGLSATMTILTHINNATSLATHGDRVIEDLLEL